mgnify:FL=1
MDIEDFVKDVLGQITNSVNNNVGGGDIKYTVDYAKGVDFDLAVTTVLTESEEKGVSGGLKVEVVGVDANKSKSASSHSEKTSRVSFNVNLRRESNHQQQIRY